MRTRNITFGCLSLRSLSKHPVSEQSVLDDRVTSLYSIRVDPRGSPVLAPHRPESRTIPSGDYWCDSPVTMIRCRVSGGTSCVESTLDKETSVEKKVGGRGRNLGYYFVFLDFLLLSSRNSCASRCGWKQSRF